MSRLFIVGDRVSFFDENGKLLRGVVTEIQNHLGNQKIIVRYPVNSQDFNRGFMCKEIDPSVTTVFLKLRP